MSVCLLPFVTYYKYYENSFKLLLKFHLDAVTSHQNFILKLEEENCSPTDGPCQGNVSRIDSCISNIAPPAPVLFLIDGADHYNILDANHESWLQLFKKIENLIEV